MSYKLIMIALVSIFAFSSCKSGKEKIPKSEQKELTNDTFSVTSINKEQIENKDVFINIDLKNNRISGKGGCNNFGANFTQENGNIELGMPMVTKMYCEESADLEHKFFGALSKVKSYLYNGTQLQMLDEEGNILIKAKKKQS